MSSSCGLDIFALSYVFWLLIGYFSLLSRLPAADWIPLLFLTIKNELFRSVQLKDARTPSVWSYHNVAFETVPVFVISRKIVERFLFPSLSLPGDRCCDFFGFVPAGSVSSSSTFFKSSEMQIKPIVMVALPASLSAWSFPFTPTCTGQYTHRCFRRWMSTIDIYQSGLPITSFVAAHWIHKTELQNLFWKPKPCLLHSYWMVVAHLCLLLSRY